MVIVKMEYQELNRAVGSRRRDKDKDRGREDSNKSSDKDDNNKGSDKVIDNDKDKNNVNPTPNTIQTTTHLTPTINITTVYKTNTSNV